jgi:hypothetical protein
MNFRVLSVEEHDKIAGLGAFEGRDHGPDPETSNVVVAEDEEGNILGYWCAFNTVHLEPLWIAPGAQSHVSIGRGLWRVLVDLLKHFGISNGFAFVAHDDSTTHLPMASKLGFQPLPVTALFIEVDNAKEV